MYRKRFPALAIWALLCFVIPNHLGAQPRVSPLVNDFILSHPQSRELTSFPWQAYEQTHPLHRFPQLERDRAALEYVGYNSEEFIEQVFRTFLAENTVALSEDAQITRQIQLGERYLRLNEVLPEAHYMYSAMGSFILEELTHRLDSLVAAGADLGISNERFHYLTTRLEESQLYVNIPVSDASKFFRHLGEGNFRYLWKRIRYRYFTEFLLLVFGGIFGLVLVLGRKKIISYLTKD